MADLLALVEPTTRGDPESPLRWSCKSLRVLAEELQEWRSTGEPAQVKVHDFVDPELGRASPYGVYDVGADQGWVSVGTDHDTGRWWYAMGQLRYPKTRELTITADSGGNNGHRVRLWKPELGRFAQEARLNIHVCHFPPGTSKWNKIEHRMLSFITMNWRAQPLVSHEVIVNLIAGTKTKSGRRYMPSWTATHIRKALPSPMTSWPLYALSRRSSTAIGTTASAQGSLIKLFLKNPYPIEPQRQIASAV